MAPMPRVYLYPGAREIAPELAPQSVVAVLHAVERRYKSVRFDVLWLRKSSLPVFRWPAPLPIHNQSWSCVEGNGGRACISCRIGDKRWTLALSTGSHRRQLNLWRSILSGQAIAGELALIGQEVTKSDHRQNGEARDPGGGRKKTIRIMAKMVAWFPKRINNDPKDGVLYIDTCPEYFWKYRTGTIKAEPKVLHSEHMKRLCAEAKKRRIIHDHHVQAMSDDMKYEKRWPTAVRRRFRERQDQWVIKSRNRINTFIHEVTAMISNFAERQRVAVIMYNDSDRSYLEGFPWHQVKTVLEYKLSERGIKLEFPKKEKE
jgi:hypothetical protein